MTNYTWTITNLFTLQQPNPDYVVTANWTLTGIDGEYTASINGMERFIVDDNKPNYIPFADLTETTVIGWIQSALGEQGVENTKACVQGQIDSKRNPPISPENTPLPW